MGFDERDFVGGAACLDFVNTVGGHRAGERDDKLGSYDDLVAWSVAGGWTRPAAAECLRARAAADPEAAARTHARAVAFREALYAVLAAGRRRRRPPAGELDLVNAEWAAALARRRLVWDLGGWRVAWDDEKARLDAPLWPVAASAGELLLSPDLARLRECASETCGWLFLDASRNASRRWCDMRACGNRAKVRRFRGAERGEGVR